MRTGRTWAAGLLLAAVFLGHGLQCEAVAGPAHAGHVSSAEQTLHGAGIPTAAATLTGAAQNPQGVTRHLRAVCLAVLAVGLAVLLAVPALRGGRRAPPATGSSWRRGLPSPVPPRPPDLLALCVLRI